MLCFNNNPNKCRCRRPVVKRPGCYSPVTEDPGNMPENGCQPIKRPECNTPDFTSPMPNNPADTMPDYNYPNMGNPNEMMPDNDMTNENEMANEMENMPHLPERPCCRYRYEMPVCDMPNRPMPRMKIYENTNNVSSIKPTTSNTSDNSNSPENRANMPNANMPENRANTPNANMPNSNSPEKAMPKENNPAYKDPTTAKPAPNKPNIKSPEKAMPKEKEPKAAKPNIKEPITLKPVPVPPNANNPNIGITPKVMPRVEVPNANTPNNNVAPEVNAPNQKEAGDCYSKGSGYSPTYTSELYRGCFKTNKDKMTADQTKLLYDIMKYQFGALDLALFLDTHPNDPVALVRHREYTTKLHQLKVEYSKNYGPLDDYSPDEGSYWRYVNGPWPWE